MVPRRATVTPRARAVPDGEPLSFLDHLDRLLRRRATGVVNLFGPRGSGKTAALRHAAGALWARDHLLLVDDERSAEHAEWAGLRMLVVLTSRRRVSMPHLAAFEMPPWTDDDLIEYLLTVRKDRCASVMGRLKDAPGRAGLLGGLPELWAIVLDQMVEHDGLATPAEALRHWLAARLGDPYLRRLATDYCLRRVIGHRPGDDDDRNPGGDPPACFDSVDPAVGRLVAHAPVQLILAAQRVVWDLAEGKGCGHLRKVLPPELVAEVAALAAFRPGVMDELRWVVQDRRQRPAHPTAATILHATHTGWRPEPAERKPELPGARLGGAAWAGVDLAGANLGGADLSGANLDAAKLDDAKANAVDLHGATLRATSLTNFHAVKAALAHANLSAARAWRADFTSADLAGADLSGADLTQAVLLDADLRGASLRGATLRDAQMRGVNLEGADLCGASFRGAWLKSVCLCTTFLVGTRFAGARIVECDLQGVEMTSADFERTDFDGSDLAGSVLPGANLRGAKFHDAGLADVRWEGADLRGADFSGASFHTGSSRSGLVDSVVASEGTRTGFYTDDYDARDYKPPEEIRKADLCGADLRGAKVTNADFYLVDLRGARYTSDQATHFRKCGAML